MVVRAVADLTALGDALLQGVAHVDDLRVVQDLAGLLIQHVVVILPVEGGQLVFHQVARGGDHDDVRRDAQALGELVKAGEVIRKDLFVVGLGGVDEVAVLAVVDALGGVAAGGQVPIGVHAHEEIPAGDLVGGEFLQLLLGLALENVGDADLRALGEVPLLVDGVILVRPEEEEQRQDAQHDQKDQGGQEVIEFLFCS